MSLEPMRVIDEPFYTSKPTYGMTFAAHTCALSASVMKEGDIVIATGVVDSDGDVEVVTDDGHIEMVCPDVLKRCYEPAAAVRLMILEDEISTHGDVESSMENYCRRLRTRRELLDGRGKTCRSCGAFKRAYEFRARRSGSRLAQCRTCEATLKRQQRSQRRVEAEQLSAYLSEGPNARD